MFLKTIAAFLALPVIIAASSVPSRSNLPGYGDGGRYGFKKCTDRGRRPGKVSCINFDSIETNATTGAAKIPEGYASLIWDQQWSALNVTAAKDTIPPQNGYSAASSPNALIGSKYNPDDKKDNSPASFSAKEGTFDLFGFYIQPMGSPPPGVKVFVNGYRNADKKEFNYVMDFPYDTDKPHYFDTHKDAGQDGLWDGLNKVEIWAGYGAAMDDWEFFVDDLWLRWGTEDSESAFEAQHVEELK